MAELGRLTERLPTNPRFIVPPHVIPYGVQVSFDKVREVIVDLARRRSLRPHDPTDQAGDPARQPIGGSGSGGGSGGGGGGGGGGWSSIGGDGGGRGTSTAQ